jgi:AcrR family transcriptional regulator
MHDCSMSKRAYTLGRRAESAAETRQRLVEATAALHHERGVSAVSLRDVAERAGVSVGTAYHHFPTYLDAVGACAMHHAHTWPMPGLSIFEGVEGGAEARVQVLVRELCAWYELQPWLERIRAERALYPPIDAGMTHMEQALEQLARAAADCTADEARTIAALVDPAVHTALRRAKMPAARIPGRMAEAVLAWLRFNRRRR